MSKTFILPFVFVFILCGFTSIFAQETAKLNSQPDIQEQRVIYKRVEVILEDNSDLEKIAALGIDLHCGANMQHKNGKHVATLELSTYEIGRLESDNFQKKVLVEDLADFYEKRAIRELPKARENLQRAKTAALYKNAEAGQDLGCSEDGFPVPQNFKLGSMGGFTTYQEMLDELDQMRSLYPNLITARAPTSTTNSTIQGRDVFYVKLSDNPDVDENEAEVLYTGVHHAREPLGMMNQLYYMWYLLENYATDEKVRNIVDNTELYFIPVVNPDGYLYNQQTNPNGGGMWRKNRRNNGDGTFGVDPNRNYGYQWGLNNTGSSPTSSSDTYRGTGPFSEPETQMMRDFVQSHNFVNAFNNHSYSNLMLRPWGYTNGTHAEEELYDEMSEHMCWHNRYHYGNGNEVIYPVNGEANDWFYGVEDIFAWTPEIGSAAEGGFWPDPSYIVPQCDRQMKMSLILASSAANYGVLNDLTPYSLDAANPTLTFSVEHMSNIDGGFTVNVSSSSPYVTGIANSSLSTGTLTQANFATISTGVTLGANTPAGAAITFDVVLNNGTYDIHTTTITKIYDAPTLISDNGSSLNNWTSNGGWGTTNSGYSGSSSITDSPSGNMSTATRTLTLSAPLDISSIQSPVLEYYTKWDISRLFDFVQIEASTNGSSWSELCGTYTKPGSSPDNVWGGNGTPDQPTGEGLYDGFQKEWVREQIDLSAYAGVNTLYLRFKADGDTERTQLDGFYFDDFTVYREPLGHCENGVQDADETDVDCGGADCIACPTCSDGIQNGSETGVDCGGPDCAICPPEYCPTYDFNVDPIIGYDAGQDFGPAIIQDGGATVYMDGNAWKALAINYTVTANTVLEFDFKSTVEGEIHEIGVDNDLTLAPDHRMVLYGNQGYAGTFSGGTYNGSGNWQSFAVPIGATFTGTFTYLVLTADDDANSAGNSYYRNIKIYEDEDGDLECDDLVCVVGDTCDDGDACTTGETYDNTCNCTGGTVQDADNDGVCDADDQCPGFDNGLIGTACDDGNACTTGETYDANCGCSGGTVQDADNDGVCDADDACPGFDNGLIGTSCDDGDACTTGETYDANCGCSGGVVQDADNDGVCDADDVCPNMDDALIGTTCDDGNDCTTGDVYDANCNCAGTASDSDNDGVCDADDVCPNFDDALIGTSCDDGDACTTGETYDANCGCSGGVVQDADGDGVCDADDICPNMDDALIGTTCDDGNDCTTGDVYDANCNCAGTASDSDNDGVCDADDVCPNFDDALIGTSCDDGDACTTGETYDANCGCSGGTVQDTDGDGVCDADDVCPLGDDNVDVDGNGTPDACDASDDCPAVDFMVDAPATYGGGQDQGTVAVQDGGATIELNSNAWKMITVNYNVTANTVVEFDFKSNQIGEIHGIGFDTNTSISSNYTFKVYGTQNWGNSTFNTYSGNGSYEHFVIPVGQFYTGQFPYFFFVTDHDSSPQNGNSFFSNLQIYEDANGDGLCDGTGACADSDADGVCDDDDICADGDDNADTDGDGEPDDCDICPNDATNSCGSAPTYCGASGNNTNYEYIDRVIFGNIDNTSGANGGYADFTAQVANVGLGDAVPFGLTPGFAGSTYNEAWVIWIDFNRDGDFDDAGEAVYTGTSAGTLSGNVNIPASASLGLTGMRIAMQWNNPAASCGTFTYGEVEDYTVNITATPQQYNLVMLRNEDNLVADPSMRIYPNPSVDFINIGFQNIRDNGTIEIYDLSGKPIGEQTVESESDDLRVEVSHLPAGTYIIRLKFEDNTYATRRFVKLSK